MAKRKSLFGKVIGAIGSVAPTVARFVGGPLAGEVVDGLKNALGMSGSTETEFLDAIENPTPEQMKIIAEYDLQMARLPLEAQKAYLGDRQDARALAKSRGLKSHLAITIVDSVIFFLVVGALLWAYLDNVEVNSDMERLLDITIGALLASFTMTRSFWFGTSSENEGSRTSGKA